MSKPIHTPTTELERFLCEELGMVDGFRRALEDAPAKLRPGLLSCLRFHELCVVRLRKLIDSMSGMSADGSDESEDFEIVDAGEEEPTPTFAG